MAAMPTFDGSALIRALDAQREERGLDWVQTAEVLTLQAADLRAELADNAMCPGALVRTVRRGTMSCQYAVILLRWLQRSPEEFLVGQVTDVGVHPLPDAGPDRRLRWDLPQLYEAMNARRRELDMTWVALAAQLDCSPSRLTNLRTARLADMGLTMRITQWLALPAANFVHPATW